jgi:hypothetical protein
MRVAIGDIVEEEAPGKAGEGIHELDSVIFRMDTVALPRAVSTLCEVFLQNHAPPVLATSVTRSQISRSLLAFITMPSKTEKKGERNCYHILVNFCALGSDTSRTPSLVYAESGMSIYSASV